MLREPLADHSQIADEQIPFGFLPLFLGYAQQRRRVDGDNRRRRPVMRQKFSAFDGHPHFTAQQRASCSSAQGIRSGPASMPASPLQAKAGMRRSQLPLAFCECAVFRAAQT